MLRARLGARGLSMVEIAVAVVVVVALSAAVAPGVVRTLDRERVETTVSELQKIAGAMHTMRTDNQDWPRRLRHLSHPITTSDTNICGTNYQSGKVGGWEGPYLDRVVPSAGLRIGVGVAQDSMLRDPPTSGGRGGSAFADMIILIDEVSEEDAVELNRLLDNDNSSTTGAIRWTVTDATTGIVQVRHHRPIKSC